MTTVSTPKPLVKSECCKAKMYTVGNTTHHWRCDNCGQPCNPSETNEADYLKEFDELFGVSKDDDLITTTRYCLHNFLKSSIERARREGVNQERERWINQPANQHDEKIRKVERQRVVEMLERMKWDSREEITEWLLGKEDTAKRNMLIDEIIKNISDLQSKLGGTK